MMFKKKSNLPPRPKYPTIDQMMEDLATVTKEDPLFPTVKMILEKRLKTDASQEDDIYEEVKMLLKSHDDLQEVIKNLDTANKSLREKENEIITLSEDLKNQAIKALM